MITGCLLPTFRDRAGLITACSSLVIIINPADGALIYRNPIALAEWRPRQFSGAASARASVPGLRLAELRTPPRRARQHRAYRTRLSISTESV